MAGEEVGWRVVEGVGEGVGGGGGGQRGRGVEGSEG